MSERKVKGSDGKLWGSKREVMGRIRMRKGSEGK